MQLVTRSRSRRRCDSRAERIFACVLDLLRNLADLLAVGEKAPNRSVRTFSFFEHVVGEEADRHEIGG